MSKRVNIVYDTLGLNFHQGCLHYRMPCLHNLLVILTRAQYIFRSPVLFKPAYVFTYPLSPLHFSILQVPLYCLGDSSQCLFLLKKEFDFREELKDLRSSNIELEYKVMILKVVKQK
jgi:hypothetical protein